MRKISTLIVMIMCFSMACKTEKKVNIENETTQKDTVMNHSNTHVDIYDTNNGELKVSLIGHASIMFEYNGEIIHVDPYSNVADYSKYPKADLIILTHGHRDHLDTAAIDLIKKPETQYLVSKTCNEILGFGQVINNGDKTSYKTIAIEAIPSYNIVNKIPDGDYYHPKGKGNGYIFTFGDKKVYVAGDTENIPEMDGLKGSIYIAFMPKNLPYTMTDEMFIDAARKVMPEYLYPYHFSEFDNEKIETALKDTEIKILVRPMSSK